MLTAHLIDPATAETLDVVGAIVQILTPAEEEPCVLRGTIPAGGVVPLHSHADPETFFVVSGEVEGLVDGEGGTTWAPITPGDLFHVPGGAKHAFRNRSGDPVVNLILTTARIGRFFREIGVAAAAGTTTAAPPSAEAIERFLQTSARYGYWNATPDENAEVGLTLPP